MIQDEIMEILSTKLRRGQITRRQFTQAAALFGFGAIADPVAVPAHSPRALPAA